ncbi:MAG: radical SAM protein [Oscillospiraceae bacterium]|nr:radical SAM protein [Oscillospiraceae bacterium]
MKQFNIQFSRDDRVAIWGKGMFIEETVAYLERVASVCCIADSNQRGGYTLGKKMIPVVGPDEICNFSVTKAVISVSGAERFLLRRKLMEEGLAESDIFFAYELIPVLAWELDQRLVIPTIGFFIGTPCSLKCRNCIAGVGEFVKNKNYCKDISEVRRDLKAFFGTFDYVKQISLSTGDHFLHPQLHLILDEIHQYQNQFDKVIFVLNAATLPSAAVAEAMKKYQVQVLISDYTENSQKCDIDRLVNRFEQIDGIHYRVFRHLQGGTEDGENLWSDIGNTRLERNRSSEESRRIFERCANRSSQCMHNMRLYGCGVAVWREIGGLYQCTENDFCALTESKENILNFYLGMVQKGYYDVCTHCDGVGPEVNPVSIPAGVQMEE